MADEPIRSRQPDFTPAGPARLRTLVLIRWVGIAGQIAALLAVQYGLGFSLPFENCLLVVAASACLNLTLTFGSPATARLTERAAALFLAFDVCQLGALLYLTGGLENPFSFLLLAPVTVSATILTLRSTIALCLLALICISALAVWHQPLPWFEGGVLIPLTYVAGTWMALVLGVLFVASYGWRVAEEARRMANAYSAAQLALAREQRLSALGGLAAAAAHELGTPLGTIAVVAREIARELPSGSPLAEDAQLLLDQSARCRDILARLSERPETTGHALFDQMPVPTLVEVAAAPYITPETRIAFSSGPEDSTSDKPIPELPRTPETLHGLGNLIQNALHFARTRVWVDTQWSTAGITVTIRDDGPGFPPGALDRIGEPYYSSRTGKGEHMGLGVFIAITLLQHSGGSVRFANQQESGHTTGAEVSVVWPASSVRPRG